MADMIVCKPQLRLESLTSDRRELAVQSTVEYKPVDSASNASIFSKHNHCDVTQFLTVRCGGRLAAKWQEREKRGAHLCCLTMAERKAQAPFYMCVCVCCCCFVKDQSEFLINCDFITTVCCQCGIWKFWRVLFGDWTGWQETGRKLLNPIQQGRVL